MYKRFFLYGRLCWEKLEIAVLQIQLSKHITNWNFRHSGYRIVKESIKHLSGGHKSHISNFLIKTVTPYKIKQVKCLRFVLLKNSRYFQNALWVVTCIKISYWIIFLNSIWFISTHKKLSKYIWSFDLCRLSVFQVDYNLSRYSKKKF